MLIYEKDGKLNIAFQKSANPPTNADVELYKESSHVVAYVGNNNLSDATKLLKSLSVTGFTKAYTVGDTLATALENTVVKCKYDDGTSVVVTTYTTTPSNSAVLAITDTTVVFSYTEGEQTVTKSITIAVNDAETE